MFKRYKEDHRWPWAELQHETGTTFTVFIGTYIVLQFFAIILIRRCFYIAFGAYGFFDAFVPKEHKLDSKDGIFTAIFFAMIFLAIYFTKEIS